MMRVNMDLNGLNAYNNTRANMANSSAMTDKLTNAAANAQVKFGDPGDERTGGGSGGGGRG